VAVPAAEPLHVTLAAPRGSAARQAALDDWVARLPTPAAPAVIAEGLFGALAVAGVSVQTLPPGCPCCVGLVLLRTALTRLVRQRQPTHLLILATDAAHLPRLQDRIGDGSLGRAVTVTLA